MEYNFGLFGKQYMAVGASLVIANLAVSVRKCFTYFQKGKQGIYCRKRRQVDYGL